LSCQNNDVAPETQQHWEEMKNIGYKGPKVLAENLIYFGVRDTEDEEDKQIEKLNIKNYKVDEVRYRGLETCVAEALSKLTHCEVLYISFDVDSMDCDMISYGTGTPVPKGFDQYEIIAIINQIIQTKKVVCIEFVEVNPLLDTKGNKMAETAFEVLEAITTTLVLPIE
jgi:arginase